MTKVFLVSTESLPSALKASLERTGEIEFSGDSGSADVILIYTATWNRKALSKTQALLQGSAPAVILCHHAEEPFTRDSLFRGEVSGVLSATATAEQIAAGLRAAAAGLTVRQPSANNGSFQADPGLTPRELEILRLIADGEGNKSIADILEISEHTVKFHISSIFEKLHAFNRTEAVRAGITRGLVSL